MIVIVLINSFHLPIGFSSHAYYDFARLFTLGIF